jgi:hypothetical protein
LLAAAAVALFWQVRQLLTFTRALHTGDFDEFRVGEGIWQQMFARFNFERERADRSRREYRRLLKEIRKSTDAMPDGAIILDEFNEIGRNCWGLATSVAISRSLHRCAKVAG